MEDTFTRLLQALEGKVTLGPKDITEAQAMVTAALQTGSYGRAAELLTALANHDVTLQTGDIQGKGIAIGSFANALVIEAGDAQNLLSSLQQLRQLIEQDEESKKQVRAAEQMAAYREALRTYCASLPYLSIRAAGLPDLDSVYVPLQARSYKDPSQQATPGSGVMITDIVWHSQKHIFVIGQPGSGKSTLLRRLAEQAWSTSVTTSSDHRYLPILIPLRLLASSEGAFETRLSRALASELSLQEELPQGFLGAWPALFNIRWLFLFDALDEIPADESRTKKFIEWLKPFLAEKNYRFVITTRPSGYSANEFSDTSFNIYTLLPLNEIQTIDMAQKWFGPKTEEFLVQLQRVQVSDLAGTPLLLTVAASIFKTAGSLPKRSTSLYRQYVETWLKEAEFGGMPPALRDRISEIALPLLTQLAWQLTNQKSDLSLEELSQTVESYFRERLQPISIATAKVSSRQYVQGMAQYSGVFVRRGNTYEFVHQTFREYFAALKIVEQWKQNNVATSLSKFVNNHWQDPSQLELLRFASTALADEEINVEIDRSIKNRLLRHAEYEPGTVQHQDKQRRPYLLVLAVVLILSLIVFLGNLISWEGLLFVTLLVLPFLFLSGLLIGYRIHLLERLDDWKAERVSQLDRQDTTLQQLSAQSIQVIGALRDVSKTSELVLFLQKLSNNVKLSGAQRIAIAFALGDTGNEARMSTHSFNLLKLIVTNSLIETYEWAGGYRIYHGSFSNDGQPQQLQDALNAIGALTVTGHSDDLLDLARSSALVEQVRFKALNSLNSIGSQKLALAWAAVACDKSIDTHRVGEPWQKRDILYKLPEVDDFGAEQSGSQALTACRKLGSSSTTIEALKILAVGARDLKTRLAACTVLYDEFGEADIGQKMLVEVIMDVKPIRELEESVEIAFRVDGKGKAEDISSLASQVQQIRWQALELYENRVTTEQVDEVLIRLSRDSSATVSEKFATALQERGLHQPALQAWLRLAVIDIDSLNGRINALREEVPLPPNLDAESLTKLHGLYSVSAVAGIGLGLQLRDRWNAMRLRSLAALQALGGLDLLIEFMKRALASVDMEGVPMAEANLVGLGSQVFYEPNQYRTWESVTPPLPDLWIVDQPKRNEVKIAGMHLSHVQRQQWAFCMIDALWQIRWEAALKALYMDKALPEMVHWAVNDRRPK